MRSQPSPPAPEPPPRSAPPRLRAAGVALLVLLLSVPVLLVLIRRPHLARSPASSTSRGGLSTTSQTPAGISGRAADVAELGRHATQGLELAARGAPEASVLGPLREVEAALPSSRAAFEALPESDREPVSRIARDLQPDCTAAAARVLERVGASRDLKALTREITLELRSFAQTGYRVEEALEAAVERAMAALDSVRLDTPQAGEALRILEAGSQRIGVLQPAHDSLTGADRERSAAAARRLIQEFSALGTAAALSPRWSTGLRDAATELLELLSSFAN
ncbi:MAG: hypothetical protein J0L84_03090 [Verrucomicrobia bacterium]|nr:hypothetical protein [Verrucomicrobiota bacterium]